SLESLIQTLDTNRTAFGHLFGHCPNSQMALFLESNPSFHTFDLSDFDFFRASERTPDTPIFLPLHVSAQPAPTISADAQTKTSRPSWGHGAQLRTPHLELR